MDGNLVHAVVDHARSTPSAPALTWRGTSLTYADLADRMRSARARLEKLTPGPIGIRADKSPDAVALILACQAAGRRFLLPPTTLPGATLADLFTRAGCVHIVSPDNGDISIAPGSASPSAEPPEPVSFMLTTSGSTGTPKIVPIPERAVDRFTAWAHRQFDLGPGRRVLNFAPLNFDLCLLEIWAALARGGHVLMVDPARATNGRALLDLLDSGRPHVVQAVPMLYELLLDASRETGQPLDFADHVIVTGDALRPSRIAGLHGLFGAARLYNVYGCTETNDSFLHEIDPAHDPSSPIPLGRPLPGVRALLVADDGAVLHGPGVGELLVSTPFQTSGYLNTPGTEGKFSGNYFRSGDLVRRTAGGTLVLEGRKDFRVKVRGQQVNLEEVEQVLLAHRHVLEAAAVAVPDPRAGHRLHAVVRGDGAGGLDGLVLRRHCADRLPTAAIPSTLRITDEPLPRTSTGKVDRKYIRAKVE